MRLFGLFLFFVTWAVHAENLPSYLIKDKKELKALQQKVLLAPANSKERAWLNWQLALNAPQVNETKTALLALDVLAKDKNRLIGADQIAITRGRVLFQTSDFKGAISAYEKVDKASEYWFEALEEIAWAHIRLNQPEEATARFATLLSPVFQTWVTPEAYFAANYNALKICDYVTVFKNGQLFKERQRERLHELELLAEKGTNSKIASVLPKLEKGELNFMAFAEEAPSLPRFFWRDEFLRRHVSDLQNTLKMKAAAPEDFARVRGEMIRRLQALAKSELSESRTVIQKLNLIEAEVIQRLYLDNNLKGVRPQLAKVHDDADTLTFPLDDELWLDEINSHRARVKACPQLKEAKL